MPCLAATYRSISVNDYHATKDWDVAGPLVAPVPRQVGSAWTGLDGTGKRLTGVLSSCVGHVLLHIRGELGHPGWGLILSPGTTESQTHEVPHPEEGQP